MSYDLIPIFYKCYSLLKIDGKEDFFKLREEFQPAFQEMAASVVKKLADEKLEKNHLVRIDMHVRIEEMRE